MRTRRIIGIDPGSVTSGFGVIEIEGRKVKYIGSGILKLSTFKTFPERVRFAYESAIELVKTYQVHEVSMESLIFVKSPTSLMKLSQVRGALLAGFAKTHAGQVFDYSPNLIKTVVAGHGHAKKEAMQKAVGWILGVKTFASHDESDALAIALCHGLQHKVTLAPRSSL